MAFRKIKKFWMKKSNVKSGVKKCDISTGAHPK
jgi:hypothetical protein